MRKRYRALATAATLAILVPAIAAPAGKRLFIGMSGDSPSTPNIGIWRYELDACTPWRTRIVGGQRFENGVCLQTDRVMFAFPCCQPPLPLVQTFTQDGAVPTCSNTSLPEAELGAVDPLTGDVYFYSRSLRRLMMLPGGNCLATPVSVCPLCGPGEGMDWDPAFQCLYVATGCDQVWRACKAPGGGFTCGPSFPFPQPIGVVVDRNPPSGNPTVYISSSTGQIGQWRENGGAPVFERLLPILPSRLGVLWHMDMDESDPDRPLYLADSTSNAGTIWRIDTLGPNAGAAVAYDFGFGNSPIGVRICDRPGGNCPGNCQRECSFAPPTDTSPASCGVPTATAGCGTPTYVDSQPVPGCGGSQSFMRTWSTPGCCAAGTCEQSIEIVDTTAPALGPLPLPADQQVSCDAVPPPAVLTASDACEGSLTVSFAQTRADGTCPHDYTLTRTWTAADGCNPAVVHTQRIDVVDRTAPVFDLPLPQDMTIGCSTPPPPAPTVTARDNCDPDVTVQYDPGTLVGDDCNGTITRTWTAEDDCGNTAVHRQVITIDDTQPPTLVGVPPSLSVECTNVPPPPAVTAIDNCDPAPPVTYAESRVDGNCAGDYTLTRTWTSTDRCGNSTAAQQVITVRDTTPPVVDPGDLLDVCLWPPNHWYVCFDREDFPLVATDACSDPTTWRFTGCASDQPDDAPDPAWPGWNGDGSTTNDCQVLPDGRGFCVRAERCGSGPTAQDGRHYTVTVVASDDCGNATGDIAVATVHVPHDRSPANRCLKTTDVGCHPNQPIPCETHH